MSEEASKPEQPVPEKLLIDNPSDFLFHAAYLAYSETFDRTTAAEARSVLNENILALQQHQIDCPTFYRNIGRFRSVEDSQRSAGRPMFKTQRKKEWRRQTQKHERIERHRK